MCFTPPGLAWVEAILASMPGQASVDLYVSPATLPADFNGTAEAMRGVAEKFADASDGKLLFTESDPTGDPALREGVYVGNLGPGYETPAEIRMLAAVKEHGAKLSVTPSRRLED